MLTFTRQFTVLAALFLLCANAALGQKYPQEGDMVPSFKVAMSDGSTVNIDDLRGKVVVVSFWATWCHYCREELREVQDKLIDPFASKGLVFLPISRGEAADTVRAFLKEIGYGFVSGIDDKTEIFPLFADTGIPRNYLIDRSGRIASIGIGYSEEIFDAFVDDVARVIKKK